MTVEPAVMMLLEEIRQRVVAQSVLLGGINESDALPLAWLCGTVRAEVMQHEVLLQARRKGRSAGGF